MSAPHIEIELKLAAKEAISESALVSAVAEAGFALGPPRKRSQVDRYLDTPRLDLARHGVGLRVREADGTAQIGVKLRGRPEKGIWRRVELEQPHDADAEPPAVAAALPELLRHAVEPFALARPLEETVRLSTERTRWALRAPATGASAELCMDRVLVRGAAGVRGAFDEIEVEAQDGDAESLAVLAQLLQERAGLEPSAVDKLERALALLGVELEPLGQRAGLLPAMPLRAAAARVLATYFEALRVAEFEARRGEDAEGVHRMRVATRRTRAAFRIFAPAFGVRMLAPHLRLFRRMGRELGRVRDLDVLIGHLPELAAAIPPSLAVRLEPLDRLLHEMWRRERRRLLAWLQAPARLRAAERYETFLERAASAQRLRGEAARPVGEVAPAILKAAWSRVLRRGDRVRKDSAPEVLHGLRIDVKRLRYAADAVCELYADGLAPLRERTTRLQDVLGAYNDACVGGARLTAWADNPAGRRLPRETLLAVGAMLAAFEARAEAARSAFKKAWREFGRGKHRRELDALLAEPPA